MNLGPLPFLLLIGMEIPFDLFVYRQKLGLRTGGRRPKRPPSEARPPLSRRPGNEAKQDSERFREGSATGFLLAKPPLGLRGSGVV